MRWSRLLDPERRNFDFATGDSISALEMLQKIAAAGKSYFLLNTQSVASVGREGLNPGPGLSPLTRWYPRCRPISAR
jgi:hypothetical protein